MSDNQQEILAAISQLRDTIKAEDVRYLRLIGQFHAAHLNSIRRLHLDLNRIKVSLKSSPEVSADIER